MEDGKGKERCSLSGILRGWIWAMMKQPTGLVGALLQVMNGLALVAADQDCVAPRPMAASKGGPTYYSIGLCIICESNGCTSQVVAAIIDQ